MTGSDVVYRETRERLGAFVLGLGDDASEIPVPACPGWSVQDTVGHLVGIVADILDGRLEDVGSDDWTLAQVTARRGLPIAEVVAEWDRRAPAFEEQVASWPAEVAAQLVADAAMHELDVRGACGDTGARDTAGAEIAFDYYAHKLADRLVEAGLPALALECETGGLTLGEGTPGATLRASRFEVLRAMGGRRSPDQVRAYDWTGDATPYVGVIGGDGTRAEPLVE